MVWAIIRLSEAGDLRGLQLQLQLQQKTTVHEVHQ